MKHPIYTLLVIACAWSIQSNAQTPYDSFETGAHGLSIQPYTSTYKYQTSAPVNIQTESFSLFADSGSLQHDIAIQLSVIPRKGGTLMPSNMENVCWLSDFQKKFQIYFDISRKSCIFAQNLVK